MSIEMESALAALDRRMKETEEIILSGRIEDIIQYKSYISELRTLIEAAEIVRKCDDNDHDEEGFLPVEG